MWHNLIINYVEADAANIVSLINSENPFLGDALFLISDIKALRVEVGGCHCQAIPRSANCLAHGLANLAFSSCEELLWWDVSPSCIFPGC